MHSVFDSFESCFGVNICVNVANDHRNLVFGGRDVRIVDCEGPDVVQLQVPSDTGAFQATVENLFEFLNQFCPNLHVVSSAVICPDVFDIFLQVLDLQRSFQTDAKLAKGRALSF